MPIDVLCWKDWNVLQMAFPFNRDTLCIPSLVLFSGMKQMELMQYLSLKDTLIYFF